MQRVALMESNRVVSSQIYSSSQGCKFIDFNPGSFHEYKRKQQANHSYANICIRPLTRVKGLAKFRRSITFYQPQTFTFYGKNESKFNITIRVTKLKRGCNLTPTHLQPSLTRLTTTTKHITRQLQPYKSSAAHKHV